MCCQLVALNIYLSRALYLTYLFVFYCSDVFNNLDQLASRMQVNRLSGRPSDHGLQNALSLFNTVEQLEFSRNSWLYESSLSQYVGTDDHGKESDCRRVDWLMDRIEAERWSHRYWGRTRTVLEGLLACSAFRRYF